MTSQAQLGITLSGELDRTVAIKVLLAHIADDPDLRISASGSRRPAF